MRNWPYATCAALLAISIAYTVAAHAWVDRHDAAVNVIVARGAVAASQSDFVAANENVHRVFFVSTLLAWLVVAHAAANVGFTVWAAFARSRWHLAAALGFGALALFLAAALASAVGGGMIG